MAKLKCPKCETLNEPGKTRCVKCQAPLPSVSFEADAPGPPAARPTAENNFQFRRGQVVNNRYTVLDMIGRGGMGCIYKVHDNVLGEDLALKTLLPQFVAEKTVVDRFLNEARITRKLAHPNIVRVHDIGMAGKGIFISMEHVRGDSLRAVLERQRPGERIPVRQVLHVIDQLCIALDYAHQYTIHRDIKPENIMLTEDNQVKLMDFGISKLMDNRFATAASMVMGTPYYMSPEQMRNTRDVDARADIYSVGVVLYELLTGNLPTGVPKPASQMLKEMPPALDGIVARCVEPDRDKRFRTAGELRAAIRPIIEMLDEGRDPRKTLARRFTPGATGPRSLSPRVVLVAAGVLVLVGMALALVALERYAHAPADSVVISAAGVPRLNDRFSTLARLIEAAQTPLNALTDMSTPQRQWRATGDELWTRAQEEARTGESGASIQAENALQHYLAVLMNPEDMVFVPAGDVDLDGVTRRVPGFFIDQTEVVLKEFAKFCREVHGGWPLPGEVRDSVELFAQYPAIYVAWFDAVAYAAWRGRRLPTLAQWARAAYGGPNASSVYPWGDAWKDNAANFQGQHVMAARTFREDRTWSGCYDLAGNAAEWTRTPVNTAGEGEFFPDFGDMMIVCGGSFMNTQPLKHYDARLIQTRASDLGFRCVLEIPTDEDGVMALLHRFY